MYFIKQCSVINFFCLGKNENVGQRTKREQTRSFWVMHWNCEDWGCECDLWPRSVVVVTVPRSSNNGPVVSYRVAVLIILENSQENLCGGHHL